MTFHPLRTRLASLALLTFCSSAFGQCGGINTGGGNCTPPTAPGMPGYESTGAAAPAAQPRYISQWGAIAVDDVEPTSGAVTGRATEREAKADAHEECMAKGGKNCEVLLTYDNKCAAVAWAPGSTSLASKANIDAAKDAALAECGQKRKGCQIVYSACSYARVAN